MSTEYTADDGFLGLYNVQVQVDRSALGNGLKQKGLLRVESGSVRNRR